MRAGILLVALAATPVLAADPATVWGFVLDAAGHPVPGARVVLEDQLARTTFTSPPADLSGRYSLAVAVGRSYRVKSAMAPDGTQVTVTRDAPLSVRTTGRYRLDTRFQDRVETVGAESGGPAAGVATEQTKAWYKRPAGIAAIVGIHVAALAVILAGSDEAPASPF